MRNLIEDAVRETYAELRGRDPGFCGCEQCEDDVLAYALNNLRPRYASDGARSIAYTALQMQQPGTRSEVAVVVLDGMRRVAANPRHGPRPGTPRPGGEV